MRHRRWSEGDEDPATAGPPDTHARIVEHHPDAICVHRDGVLVFGNPAAARLFGTSVNELEGLALSRFIPGRSLVSILARLAPLRRTGDVSAPVSATLHRLDGSAFHTEAVSVRTTWDGRVAYQLTLRNISEHGRPSDEVALQAMLVEHATDAVIAVTVDGMVTSWNPAAELLYRRSPEQALARPVAHAVGAPVPLDEVVRGGGVLRTTHFAADGTSISVRLSIAEFDHGYVLQSCEESDGQRADRDLHAVVDALQEGVVIVGQNRRPLAVNAAARDILGLHARDTPLDNAVLLTELPLYDGDGNLLGAGQNPVEETFRTGLPTRGRLIGVDRADGSRVWLMAGFQLLHPDSAATSPVLFSFFDFTSQQATTERLAHQAAHDVLTGLPNRAHIMEAVGTLSDNGRLCAVLFIDLDDVKTVNDTLGHDIGDVVIQTSAQRLREVVRDRHTVGRFSGDEFVVLIKGQFDEPAIDGMVTRIKHALTQPLDVSGVNLTLGASIGVERVEADDPRGPSELLRDADRAMYADKRVSRQTLTVNREPGLGVDAPIR